MSISFALKLNQGSVSCHSAGVLAVSDSIPVYATDVLAISSLPQSDQFPCAADIIVSGCMQEGI